MHASIINAPHMHHPLNAEGPCHPEDQLPLPPSVTTNTSSPGQAAPGPTEYSRRSSASSASTSRSRTSTYRRPLQKKVAHPRSYLTAASQDTPLNHWNDCRAPIDVIDPATW